MPLTKAETAARTVKMLAHFLHFSPPDNKGLTNTRRLSDLDLTNQDMDILEVWIEGPISKSKKGFFQDAGVDVSATELKDLLTGGKTIGDLTVLIFDKM